MACSGRKSSARPARRADARATATTTRKGGSTMTRATIRSISAIATATACAWLTTGALGTAAAQSATDKKPAPAPKLTDGHPDLSGVWWGGADVGGRGFTGGGRPPAGGGTPPPTYASLY